MAEVTQTSPLGETTRGLWGQAGESNRAVSEGAMLRVTRKPVRFRDRARAYRVLVDGVQVGQIRDGQTADFSIPAGHHEIRLKLDWTGSKVLSLDVSVPKKASAVVTCGFTLA